jgi:hypothetical protein
VNVAWPGVPHPGVKVSTTTGLAPDNATVFYFPEDQSTRVRQQCRIVERVTNPNIS